MIDRRLYLPETTWCERSERLTAAGVPDEVGSPRRRLWPGR